MPPYRQRVVAPPARPAGRFARGAAPPLWQSAGFGSVGCPPPPCAPCAASARLGLALAAPPFSVGAWLRGGSRRGNDTPLGFPAHTLPYRCGKPTTLSTVSRPEGFPSGRTAVLPESLQIVRQSCRILPESGRNARNFHVPQKIFSDIPSNLPRQLSTIQGQWFS